MADSYVCSGAKIRCTMGTGVATLTVLPPPVRTVLLTGKPQANVSDTKPIVNVGSCGNCRSLLYPPTAAATAAAEGVLTPMPCVPSIIGTWFPGKLDYLVQGPPALLKSDHCQCAFGGTVSLINDGQTPTGPADMSRISSEEFEKDQVSTEGLEPDDVLDGIQMALDVAGMVPLAGAVPDLLNAAVSACRGNWADAGLSLLAAVPGAGDAVGAAKIAKDGVKVASKIQKGTKATETATKLSKNSEKIVNGTEKGWAATEKNLAKDNSKEELRKIRAKMLEKETGIKVDYDPKNSQTLYDSVDPKYEIKTPEFKETKGNPFSPKNNEEYLTKWDKEEIAERKAWENIQKSSEDKGWNPYSVKDTTNRMEKQSPQNVVTPSPKEISADDIIGSNNKSSVENLKDFKWKQPDVHKRYPKANLDD